MNDRQWKVLGVSTGVGFVVLSILATFLYPQPPRVDSNPAVVLGWAHGHRVGIEAAMAIGIFAAMLFVGFAVYMKHRLDLAGNDALGSVAYASGIALAAVYALGGIPVATLVFMDGQPGGVTDGSLVRLLIDLNQILFAPAAGLGAVFLLALGVAVINMKAVVSPVIGWAAIVVSLFGAVEVVATLTFSSYHAGAWTAVGWIAYLGFLAVILVGGIALTREAEASAPMPRQAVLTS